MKTLKINAKAAPVMEQMLSKINCGFKNIEIQLLHELVLPKYTICSSLYVPLSQFVPVESFCSLIYLPSSTVV